LDLSAGPYPEVTNQKTDVFYSYALNLSEPLSRGLLYPGTNNYFNSGLGMRVRQPASFMFLHETGQDGTQAYSTPANWFPFSHQHNTAMNVLFMDGHVDTRTAVEMLPNGTNPWTDNLRDFLV